jgi:hypothetical protein
MRILVLCAALVAGTAAWAPGLPSRTACGAMETRLNTFTVTAEAQRKSYEMGETVVVEMLVTRPGPEDPVTGEPWDPPHHEPAEGVDVGINMSTSDTDLPVFNSGTTDAEGKATVKVKLVRGDPPRWVYAYASAEQWYNRGGCPDIVERGGAEYPKFFKLVEG